MKSYGHSNPKFQIRFHKRKRRSLLRDRAQIWLLFGESLQDDRLFALLCRCADNPDPLPGVQVSLKNVFFVVRGKALEKKAYEIFLIFDFFLVFLFN